MWILLPWRHLLLLSLVVVLVAVVVVMVVIVQVTAVVVVKSWPELVNSKLGKHILGATATKYKLGARAGIYKFGTRARAGDQTKGQGPGNTNNRILNIREFHQILATTALINLLQNVNFYFRIIRSLSWLIDL